jgi:hypothetical protein
MSDADQAHFPDFGKLVPGFDFLKNLSGQAAASAPPAMPGMAQLGAWVAPTLNVEELDKRIAELKAVQFWLDQNAAALKATIQALEVQKMTLVALKGMNVNMNEMAQAFTARMPGAAPAPEPAAKPQAAPDSSAKAAEGGAAVDPMQWWGALTQQFQSIAQAAIKDASVRKPSTAAPRTGKKSATSKSATKAKAKAPAGRTSTTQAKAPARKAAPRSR